MITGAVSETAAKVLESTIAVNLLNPVAVEVGQLLGDIAGMVRFYATDNLTRIFTKWAQMRASKPPLKAEEFRRVMPVLQMASMQSDESLQARWARLLEATATDSKTMPSFATMLSQLTPDEAKALDHLWSKFVGRRSLKDTHQRVEDFSLNAHESTRFHFKFENRSDIEIQDVEDVMLSDFERLGIIEKRVAAAKPPFPGSTMHSPINVG